MLQSIDQSEAIITSVDQSETDKTYLELVIDLQELEGAPGAPSLLLGQPVVHVTLVLGGPAHNYLKSIIYMILLLVRYREHFIINISQFTEEASSQKILLINVLHSFYFNSFIC